MRSAGWREMLMCPPTHAGRCEQAAGAPWAAGGTQANVLPSLLCVGAPYPKAWV